MRTISRSRTASLVLAGTLFLATAGHAGDSKVMTSGAFTAASLQLSPSGQQPVARQSAEENLKRRNITLPPPAAPAGNDVRAVRAGSLLFLSSASLETARS